MKRTLGVCTWTFGPMPLPDVLSSVAQLGFDGVELHGDLEAFRPPEIRALVADHALRIFSLTPANEVSGIPVDLAHPRDDIRRAAVDYFRRLIDFAHAVGQPLVSLHGYVGRIAPLDSMVDEQKRLVDSVTLLATYARQARVELVFEVLNRYESHLINTADEALRLLHEVASPNLRILLDAYHMNIEEKSPAGAVLKTGHRLGLFHVADSNRQAIGYGHTDWDALGFALDTVGYDGPIIVECTPPGPNPFTAVKGKDSRAILEGFLRQSRTWLAERRRTSEPDTR